MRCTSMAKGRVRCPNEATRVYHTSRVGPQGAVAARYPRCDAHPLGNAAHSVPVASGGQDAPTAAGEAR